MADKLYQRFEELGLKGEWLTNADPSTICATPDGKGYSDSGYVYPDVVLGRPMAPDSYTEKCWKQWGDQPGQPHCMTTEDLERLGLVGLYKKASWDELLRKPKLRKEFLAEMIEPDALFRRAGDEFIILDKEPVGELDLNLKNPRKDLYPIIKKDRDLPFISSGDKVGKFSQGDLDKLLKEFDKLPKPKP